MSKTIKIKSFLYIITVLVVMVVAHSSEAKSLKKGEVYRSWDGKYVIEVVSENEVEMMREGGITEGSIIPAQYTFKNSKLRIVFTVLGTKMVEYYELTHEGLKDTDGNVLYSKSAFAEAKQKEREGQLYVKSKKSEFRLVSYVKDQDSQRVIPIEIGKRYKVPGSGYTVTVKDYYPDAEIQQEPINVSNEPKNPAVYVQLLDSDNVIAEGWLLANDRNFYNDSKHDLKVEYLWVDNEEDYERLAKTGGKNTKPKLDITIEGKNIFKSVSIEEGKSFSIDGTDYKVEIKEFALDYAKRTTPLKEQTLGNPAVRVEISGPQGVDTLWTFSMYPDYWDKAHKAKYTDIKLSCSVPDDFSIASNSIRIVQNKNGKQTISYLKDKKLISITDWEINKKYDIDYVGLQLEILKYFPSYSSRREMVKKSDNIENPAIFVEIEGAKGKVSDWVLSNSSPKWYPDKNFAILYERYSTEVKD